MEQLLTSFTQSFETWGYVALFFYCMGSGYVGILAAGTLATLGHTNLPLSILIASIGNFVGSSVFVLLIRYQKRDFARFLATHRRKIALMHIYLSKYGFWLIMLNKYLYGVKFLVPLAIGASRYNLQKFFALNLIASILWASALGVLAFYFSQAVIRIAESYGKLSYAIIGGVLALLVLLIILSKKAWKKKIHA